MRLYFKNLDGLRFIAALLVILHHAQFFKESTHKGTITVLHHFLENTAIMGVNLFFVLSGFLISYLLMQETKETGTINFKNFYIRRILRIWPLYLAYGIPLIVLSPMVMHWLGLPGNVSNGNIITNLIFYLLFAVNIQLAFFPYNQGILEITWSVCVEEQFYLLWPLLLLFFRKRLKSLFIWMLIIGLAAKAMALALPYFTNISEFKVIKVNYVILFSKLDLFGMGMMAAYIYFHRHEYRERLARWFIKPVQYLVLIISILVVFSVIEQPWLHKYYFDHTLQALLFAYLVIAAVSENSIFRLEHPLLKTLGKISYGLYMFHPPLCQLIIIAFMKIFPQNSMLVYDILYPATCVAVTGVIAYYSYELFEKRFLKIKGKFAVVKTRI